MSKKGRKHKENLKKSGSRQFVNKIVDDKTGCVIIINSCDPNLKAKVFKR